ncbi:dTMP kinase [Thermoproteota archaeon]
MKGLLIVCEGLDCAGKTTTIKELLKSSPGFVYSKSLGSDTFMGKLAKLFPSTFLFMMELLYLDLWVIRPTLKKNMIILQDRHYMSLRCYTPSARKLFNRRILHFFRRFIRRPDALVYFHVKKDERIKRLRQDDNPHHQHLVKNPHIIDSIETEYKRQYRQFLGDKTIIDTYEHNIRQASEKLSCFVSDMLSPETVPVQGV